MLTLDILCDGPQCPARIDRRSLSTAISEDAIAAGWTVKASASGRQHFCPQCSRALSSEPCGELSSPT